MAQLNLHAQATLSLFTTSVSNTAPAMGQPFNLFTKLVNTSAVDSFKGVIDFSLANENGLINDVNVFGKPAVSGNFITLAPLQEMNLLFTVTPQPAYFVPGPDIIIVWPIAAAPVVDSAIAQIDIQEPSSIAGIKPAELKVFAQNDVLMLQLLNSESSLKHVQILSVTGNLLIAEALNGNSAGISIAMLPKGMYVVEVLTADGRRSALKFVRD